MRGDDRALAALAESVADGTAVDWQAAVENQNPQIRRLARHLRLVDSIAALHRSIPSEDAVVAPADRHQSRGRRWGRLVLLEPIGSGASCDVYRAWDAELHRDVALKLLHEEGSNPPPDDRLGALRSSDGGEQTVQMRVLQEARRMARLRHEHVVQVYGAEQHDGRVGLWMELVRGTSLEQLVQQRGSFGANEAALIGLDICAALAAVHGAGLLHRDVKAQNVMREDGGRIVLMDFGTGEELTGTNRLVGTPLYLAPEIFEGQRASVQSDVYAVGVLLFYLVTGAFPVTARSMEDLARAHKQRERRTLRDLRPDAPQGFVGAVERALDSDPARRFRTVGELDHALRDSLVAHQRARADERRLDAGGDAAPDPAVWPRPTLQWIAIAAVVIALALLTFALMSRASGASDARRPRIAVLPLRSLPPGPAGPAAHLADRLTDELIATLGQMESVRVTSLAAVLPFKGGSASPQQIGQALEVDSIVDSTLLVTTAGDGKPDRVRVQAKVLTAGGSEILNRDFERPLGETRALHGDLVKAIADALGVSITPDEARRLNAPRTTSPEANAEYYLGKHLLSQSSVDAAAAAAAFRRALAIDPDHAGAHAGLARALMTQGFVGTVQHAAARATAAAEVRRALELDPDSSEAYAIEADLRFQYDWDWPGAGQSYRRATALNPSNARARSQHARYLAAAGRSAEALSEARRAVELEPGSASAMATRAMIEYYARDYTSALQSADYAIQLEPGSGSHYLVRSRVLASTGNVAEAIQSTERAIELQDATTPTSWRAYLLWLRALAGDRARVERELAQLLRDLTAARQALALPHLAYVREALGDRDQALDLLTRSVADRDPEVLWLAVDPRLDGMRTDDRFGAIVARLGIPK